MLRHYIYITLINLSISLCVTGQQLKMQNGTQRPNASTATSDMLRISKQYTSTTRSSNVIQMKVTNDFADLLKSGQFKISGSGAIQTGLKSFDQVSEQLEIVNMKRLFPNAGKHERAHQHYGLHLWYEITLAQKNYKSSGINPLEQLKNTAGIVKAEYAQIYSLGNYRAVPITLKGERNQNLNTTPNDRFFSEQWHYNNTGQSGGIPGSDIRLRYGWTQSTGDRDVIVSIHDGGIDTRHEDLAANMWVNALEKNGRTGIDDDGNGFIDDIHGFNFVNHSGTIVANDHGTHVAGTVGAVTNNAKGVAGVAGGSGNNDGIRLMSAQVFTNTSSFGFENSFLYAADNGAVISQNSWSGGEEPSEALIDAINYFIARAGYDNSSENFDKNIQTGPMAGGVVIFAAGNYGAGEDPDQEIIAYPSALPQVISVANTDHNDHKDLSSIWNDFVDLSAPGTEIASTFPGNQYGFLTGTSMACPHVSGVAALIVSKYKDQNITPEQVRERLIQRTSHINTFHENLPYEGKMGSGRLNAYHALLDNDDHAPNQINDLTIASFDGISITLLWTAPGDGSLPSANKYEVRYSTDPITFQNFDNAEMVKRVAEPSFAGEEEMITIDGLEPNTTYFFAIRASDIFQNTSDISNVVSQKTLTAPSITVSPTAMDLIVNAQNGESSHTLTIGNTGNAALSYSLSPNLQGRKILERGNPNHTQPGDVRFVGAGGGIEFITVTKFEAPAEGFNLLGIQAFYRTDNLTPQDATVAVRILRGGTSPDNAAVAATTTINSLSKLGRWHSGLLPSAVSFTAGETFWIELTYPEQATYPQAMDEEGSLPGTFFYGFDHESYADLQTAQGFEEMHFKVKAVDDFQWLHISPTEGTTNVNMTSDHAIIVDPTELVNGNYSTFFQISSNDPRQPLVEVPVNLSIVGGLPDIEIATTELNYGETFVGATITKNVTIENKGQDVLEISSIAVSSDDGIFYTPESTLMIPGKGSVELPVLFSPASTSNFSATLTLTTNDPNGDETIVITLDGVGIPAPKLVITPDPLETSLASGSISSYEFTIENQGGNNLTFKFNNTLPTASLSGEDGTFGYRWIDSRESGGPIFEWNDIRESGQSVSVADDGAIRVELPFEFPFYGESKTSVLISPNGFLTFGNTTGGLGGRISTTLPSTDDLNDLIAAYWVNLDVNKKHASITYLQEAERFTVQYTNMPPSGQFLSGTATFQIVLFADGTIKFFYKDVESSPLNTDYITGIENADGTDAMMISDKDFGFMANELAVLISPTKDFYITDIDPVSGTIEPGSSQLITLQLDAAKLMAGLHIEPLMLTTNDPTAQSVSLPLNMNITGESVPELSTSLLNFDTVFVGYDKILKFTIANKGKRTLVLTESVLEGSPNFSMLEYVFNTEIHPGATKAFTVSYFAAEEINEASATIRFITDHGELTIDLKAKGVLAPILGVNTSAVSLTLTPGESKEVQLTIKNDGASKLKYSIPGFSEQSVSAERSSLSTPHTQSRVTKQQVDTRTGFSLSTTGGSVEQGFHWIDNTQSGGPVFDWQELGNDPEVQILNLSDDAMEEVTLPFRFDFYGRSYQSIFITDNGLIGFDRNQISNTWNYRPTPTTTGNAHAFLAPFWFDFLPTEIEPGKVFIKKSAESVTVQYEDAAQRIETPFFSITMVNTFQVILYPDGSVKYQYLMVQSDNAGTIGLENYNGTQGIAVSFNDDYLHGGLAILFTPYTDVIHDLTPATGTIEPNQEAAIDFTVTANESMVDGTYTEILHVTSNDPATNTVLIPIKINILGTPDIQAPTLHDLGVILKNQAVDSEFMISNSGTKAFTVHSVKSSLPLFIVDENNFTIAPGESKSIPVSFSGTEEVGAVSSQISLVTDIDDTNGGSLTVKIPVSVKVQEAPILQLDVTNYEWYAQRGDELQVGITIGNKQGGDLKYSLSVVPYSSDDDAYQHNGRSKSFRRTSTASTSTVTYDAKPTVSHSRMNADLSGFSGNIYYDPDKEADSFLGSGGLIDSKLDVATRFVVPEDYFTLTHAFVHYKVDYFTELPVTLWVGYGGSNPDKTEIILEKQFFHPQAQNSSGFEAIIPLDTMLHFAKKDTLWMVLQYPGAAGKTQAVNLYADTAPDKYYYFDEGENEWLDANVLFPGVAFKVRALQQKLSWLNIPEGLPHLTSGKSIDVPAVINANVENGVYEARIRVENNDPAKSIASLYAALNVGTITSTPLTPEKSFSISPNPAKEMLNIKLMHNNEQILEATLLGTDGKIRHTFDLTNQMNYEGGTSLPLPSMATGLFILRLKTTRNTYSERVIIY